jgi:hypothetical protein
MFVHPNQLRALKNLAMPAVAGDMQAAASPVPVVDSGDVTNLRKTATT